MKKLVIILLFFAAPLFPKNVLLLSLPKTGTNLALKLLKAVLKEEKCDNIGAMTRGLYWAHEWKLGSQIFPTINPTSEKIEKLEKLNTKIVFLLRDPRQHIIAVLRTLQKPINHKTIAWGIQNFPLMLSKLSYPERFIYYKDINECYRDYLQWTTYSDVYITSFEKLVGPQGGGDIAVQLQEIENIVAFLGKRITRKEAQALADSLFGGTPTFKEGKIDSWKKYYSAENKALFKRVAGDLLIKLGYEKDNNW